MFSFLPLRYMVVWSGTGRSNFSISKMDFRKPSVLLLSSLNTALTISVVSMVMSLYNCGLPFFFGLLDSYRGMASLDIHMVMEPLWTKALSYLDQFLPWYFLLITFQCTVRSFMHQGPA